MNQANKIRNIAVLGHLGSGKTSLVESLNYITSKPKVKGEVEKKNTISDYLLEEQLKLSSISTSIVPVSYKDYKINLIDLPGNDDFVSEVISALKVVKGAILVIDASSGIQVQTLKHWKMLRKKNIPTIIYVNKMDKENIVFEDLLSEIRKNLGKNAVPFCYPMGHDDKFDGFINVVDMKARKFNGTECVDAEIYDDKKIKVLELNNMILEAVAQTSEELLNKFFMGEQLNREEIHSGLRTGVLNGELIPVLVGSATKNIGVHTMLDMLIDYLPNPSDLNPIVGTTKDGLEVERKTLNDEPFSGFVFKTIVDPYSGVLNLFKVNSGVVKVGDDIYCPQTGKTEKVSQLLMVSGKTQTQVQSLEAGDIGGIVKISDLSSSMTICDPKNIIIYKETSYPTAVLYKAILPKNKTDDDKLGQVLQKIKLEDKTLEIVRNNETKQLLIGGTGLGHLSYVFDKMKNTYKVEVTVEDPKIVYRETIKQKASGSGRYIKQSGGSGFYGVVEMDFEPAEENIFTEKIFGGSVPKNYFPAVEKGFYEALEQGLLAGFPVIGCKAILTDGKYHAVDSNELAFKMAAILAFKDAYMNAKPVILEPIIRVTINVENKNIGDILSDLNSRRAKIISMEEKNNDEQEIVALVPEAEIIEYANDLKALTQGGGYFNRIFETYEEVPTYLSQKVIEENKLI